MSAKDIVTAAAQRLFVEHDFTAIDELFGPSYTQHSALAADGVDGLRELVTSMPREVRYELARVIEDGPLVVTHGTYFGFAEVPLVAFDVWRVEDDRIVEHWDSLTPLIEQTRSGRSQTDGPSAVTRPESTETSRALVREFAEKILVGADYSVVPEYISTTNYDQHNPEVADGLAAFGEAAAAWAAEGKFLAYKNVHHVIAEGEFVFVRSEGEFGAAVVYNDLFRVEDGRIVEHWDVISPVPETIPHANGLF